MSLKNIFYKILIIQIIIGASLNTKSKVSDREVAMMIPKYFSRDHNAPKITRTRVYGEMEKNSSSKHSN